MRNTFIIAALVVFTAGACTTEESAEPTFEAVVEKVIAPRCTFGSCHAQPTMAADLDLTPEKACDTLVNQPSCLFPDRMRIVPGAPEESFFFHKLTGQGLHETPTGSCSNETKTNLIMPYGASELTPDEIDLVHNWIAAGAKCSGTGGPARPTSPAISSFTANRPAPLAGESIAFTLTLDQAAKDGGQTIELETDTSVLAAPLQVMVPATLTTVKFEAFALRPTSRFTVRARTAESTKEIVLRVAGLEVAEVMADPIGTDDGTQWIKIRNRSVLPIDLTSYQLKAGENNYSLVTVNLTGTLPAGSCAVIGGPAQTGSNGEPVFTQLHDFTPNLPHTGTQAAGIALFDRNAAMVGGVVTPVDTMLVGANNGARLQGPDGEVANPYCGTPVPGMSALRTGARTCVQAQMQPSSCN
jgi:hypothetical protein